MTSRHPKSWMWAQALQMLDEADQLQRRFFTEVGARDRATPNWEPPVDVFTADMDGEGITEPAVQFREMTLGEAVVEDYVAMRLTLRAHPMALLRLALDAA